MLYQLVHSTTPVLCTVVLVWFVAVYFHTHQLGWIQLAISTVVFTLLVAIQDSQQPQPRGGQRPSVQGSGTATAPTVHAFNAAQRGILTVAYSIAPAALHLAVHAPMIAPTIVLRMAAGLGVTDAAVHSLDNYHPQEIHTVYTEWAALQGLPLLFLALLGRERALGWLPASFPHARMAVLLLVLPGVLLSAMSGGYVGDLVHTHDYMCIQCIDTDSHCAARGGGCLAGGSKVLFARSPTSYVICASVPRLRYWVALAGQSYETWVIGNSFLDRQASVIQRHMSAAAGWADALVGGVSSLLCLGALYMFTGAYNALRYGSAGIAASATGAPLRPGRAAAAAATESVDSSFTSGLFAIGGCGMLTVAVMLPCGWFASIGTALTIGLCIALALSTAATRIAAGWKPVRLSTRNE